MPLITSAISGSVGATSLSINTVLNVPFVSNLHTIVTDVATLANTNSLIYGPITVSNTKSLTVTAGSNIKIKDISDA